MKRILYIIILLLMSSLLSGQAITNISKSRRFLGTTAPVTSPVTKTFSTFDASVAGEDLVDYGQSAAIAYSKDATDGAAKFLIGTSTGASERGITSTATGTWETIFGVPSGKTVTNVKVVGWKKKMVNSTDLTSLTYSILIVTGEAYTSVMSATLTGAVADDLAVDSSYEAIDCSSFSNVSVSSSYQASNTAIRFVITITFAGTATTGRDIRFDDIALEVTFN